MVSVQYMFLFDDEDDAADTAGGRRRSKVPLNAAAFATGKDVFELILGFAVAMSSSSYRPFRLTSTLAIVAVMDALSVICKNLSTELALATREQKSRKTTSLSTQQSVDMCHQRKVDTESCMMQLFKSYIWRVGGGNLSS